MRNSQKWKCPQNNSKGVLQLFLWGLAEGSMGENFSVLLNFWGRIHCLLLGRFVFRTEASLRKLVSPRNDVWETSAKIPCRWHVSTQIWLAAANFPSDKNNQKHYPDLGTDTRTYQYGISALVSQTLFRRETSGREMSAVFSGYTEASLRREWT